MNDIIVAPAPSQLDDWVLYNRIVGEHIRARQGDMGYSEWREYVAYPEEGTRSQLSTTQVGCKEKDHHPELVGEIEISQRTG
jgi:hypothetical protein